MNDREMLERIKAALNTEEDGEALIEVARNAHRAEMQTAFTRRQDKPTVTRVRGGKPYSPDFLQQLEDDLRMLSEDVQNISQSARLEETANTVARIRLENEMGEKP